MKKFIIKMIEKHNKIDESSSLKDKVMGSTDSGNSTEPETPTSAE